MDGLFGEMRHLLVGVLAGAAMIGVALEVESASAEERVSPGHVVMAVDRPEQSASDPAVGDQARSWSVIW